MDMTAIGSGIKEARERAHLTQGELAQIVDGLQLMATIFFIKRSLPRKLFFFILSFIWLIVNKNISMTISCVKSDSSYSF